MMSKYPKVYLIVVSLQIDLWVFAHHIGVQCLSTSADQCCSTLVLGHCTPVWWADILRCLCSDTTMLSACFAEQHRTVRNAFCLDQCCSALVLRHCTPIWWANTQRSICSDTTMLSACFAEQHRTVRNAFCLLQHWSRQNAFLTVLCCSANQAHSIVVSLQRHLKISAHHTGVQWPNTSALQHWSRQIAFLTALCCYAKQADSIVVSLERHLWIFCKHTGVQCAITNALQHWSGLCQRNKMHSSLPFVSLQNRLTAL